ncbi:hypothetical protein MMC29_002079 [Sticta canariensis]|nr:hypothetical protein [Sticta canariensis]
MSVATLTATDLLACDQGQVVQYLERNADADGGFNISSLDGVEALPKSQRIGLAQRLNDAALQLDNPTTSQPLHLDEILERLTKLADEQDGSPDHELSRPPAESFQSTESTPPPITIMTLETSSYHELDKDGGRPACSIQELLHILAEPMARYKVILSWLSADSEVGKEEIKTVFSRQFTRWWDFRKSQWDNRGIGDSEEGFSAFLEASRNRWEQMGAHEMVSGPTFEETIRRQWQQKPASRQLPDGQGFPAYSEAVKRRLAPHHFTRSLQLKKNPRQQTKWTNWLEYLNYEQWWLEALTAVAEPLEEQYHQALRRLLKVPRCSSREAMGSNRTNATNGSAASGSTQTRQPRPARNVHQAKELEAAWAALDAANKTVDDFAQETAPYRSAQAAVYYQRHRVQWAVKEARLMETEMSQQSKAAKSNTKVHTNENKKRRRGDDDDNDHEEKDIPPKPQSKRTRRGDGGKSAVSDAKSGKSEARRSARLANLKANTSTNKSRSLRVGLELKDISSPPIVIRYALRPEPLGLVPRARSHAWRHPEGGEAAPSRSRHAPLDDQQRTSCVTNAGAFHPAARRLVPPRTPSTIPEVRLDEVGGVAVFTQYGCGYLHATWLRDHEFIGRARAAQDLIMSVETAKTVTIVAPQVPGLKRKQHHREPSGSALEAMVTAEKRFMAADIDTSVVSVNSCKTVYNPSKKPQRHIAKPKPRTTMSSDKARPEMGPGKTVDNMNVSHTAKGTVARSASQDSNATIDYNTTAENLAGDKPSTTIPSAAISSATNTGGTVPSTTIPSAAISSATNTGGTVPSTTTPSTAIDPHAIRLGGPYIQEIIAPGGQLTVVIKIGGPVWLKHEQVVYSAQYQPFLSTYPHFDRFWYQEGRKQILWFPMELDQEQSLVRKILDMAVGDAGMWMFLVELEPMWLDIFDIQRMKLEKSLARWCKGNKDWEIIE